MVLSARWEGRFGAALGRREPRRPRPDDVRRLPEPVLAPPGPGKLVKAICDNAVDGTLTKPGELPLSTVVDCGASKTRAGLPARRAEAKFRGARSG